MEFAEEFDEFNKIKEEYITTIAPLVRKIYHDFSNLATTLSVWVTDYGDVEGNECKTANLYQLFTQCGSCDMQTPYISVDVAFADVDKADTPLHKKIAELLGGDWYEETEGCQFYRLESGDLNEYIDRLNAVKEYLAHRAETNIYTFEIFSYDKIGNRDKQIANSKRNFSEFEFKNGVVRDCAKMALLIELLHNDELRAETRDYEIDIWNNLTEEIEEEINVTI